MADLFFIRFTVSSVLISVLIILVWAIKRVLRNHISARWQYNIWLLVLLMLILPFIPNRLLSSEIYAWLNFPNFNNSLIANGTNSERLGLSFINNGDWLKDFYISVNRNIPQLIDNALIFVWVAGMLVFLLVMVLGHLKIRKIKRSVICFADQPLNQLFNRCLSELRIKRRIVFGESPLVKTPMTIGIFNPYIILPRLKQNPLTKNEVYYIVLHELIHHKHKDVLINYLMCLLQILYWFNPIVLWAFKEMRTDREMACDNAVLNLISKPHYTDYGLTILRFAEILSKPILMPMATGMSGSKKQITRRVKEIAYFKGESLTIKFKSLCIFTLIGLLIFGQSPLISVMAKENDSYKFHAENVLYEDLSEFFEGFDGSFVLYDLRNGKFSIYNKEKSIKRVSPNSTYKIYSALTALDKGLITPENSYRDWDGSIQPYEQWNKGQDLSSAMMDSVNWYFQDVDKAIGIRELESYYKQMKYGNYDLSGGVNSFWIESSLLISPFEQVLLLKDFCLNNTIFKSKHIDTVKDAIKLSEKDDAVLFGKTGTGSVNGNGTNGWFIGYVEKDGNTYIFATNIGHKTGASGSIAAKITLSILDNKRIY